MEDRRAATVLSNILVALSVVLTLVLAGSAALRPRGQAPPWLEKFGHVFGGYGAGLAWPVFGLLTLALACAALVLALRPDLRGRRRAFTLALGAAAWIAAAVMGVRPPTSRTGVFAGELVYGTVMHPDLFVPCTDPARPLPRGPALGLGRVQPVPLLALVHVPEGGWNGSHPRDWPSTVSDSHGGLYFSVRVRGTLTGPGNYGMPAAYEYRLRIDSVLHVVPRHPADDRPCEIYRESPGARRAPLPPETFPWTDREASAMRWR